MTTIQPSQYIQSLPQYAFKIIEDQVQTLRKKGIQTIDFGMGDPTTPTPLFIRRACQNALHQHKSSGYPLYEGSLEYRQTIAHFMQNRFNVKLNPETEISSTLGSKEAIFNFPHAFLNPGDYVLAPSPSYPPYFTGTTFAGGHTYFYPLLEKNNFYPDFTRFPKKILKKTKILWLNYPNNPTGQTATRSFYLEAIRFARRHNLILASDECYSEIYFKKPPLSLLEITRKNVVVFQSLSKRSCMTSYRVGWICGDPHLIHIFRQLKTNLDSGTPQFIQTAAIAALKNETHVRKNRTLYEQKLQILASAFQKIGLPNSIPEATFYLWQKIPTDYNSITFAQKLIQECGIVATPGELISQPTQNLNPGQNFVRFALMPSLPEIRLAAKRISQLKI